MVSADRVVLVQQQWHIKLNKSYKPQNLRGIIRILLIRRPYAAMLSTFSPSTQTRQSSKNVQQQRNQKCFETVKREI